MRFLVKMSSQDLSSASVVASTFRFHPAAEVELSAAADWYEARRPGLGRQFVDAVHAKVDDIVDGPERWPLSAGTRRALMTRFPYAVVYRVAGDDVVEIVAVAHLKRRPKYWARR